MIDKINYHLLYSLFYVLSLFPLRGLYLLSDILAWLAHSVVRYRRGVVRSNLMSAFPEKDISEIKKIEKGFYRFLGDYFVETVKLTTMSERQMRRRLEVIGAEEINATMKNGKSCTLLLGHYCNWEWVSSLPIHFNKDATCVQIYHPLENKGANEAFLRLRNHFGATSVSMDETLPFLIKCKKEGRPTVTGYIADQAPLFNSIHLWVDFLNHETPVFTGPERISKFLKAEVFYVDIKRPRRGYYTLHFRRMTSDASTSRDFEVTRHYYALLQDSIEHAPQYWLWSHKRWKRTREEFNRLFGDKADDRLQHL